MADGSLLSLADLAALAELPPRDVLLARVAGALAAPLQQMAGLLQALPRNLAYGLSALKDQREAAGETGPAETETAPGSAETETAATTAPGDEVEAAPEATSAPEAEAAPETAPEPRRGGGGTGEAAPSARGRARGAEAAPVEAAAPEATEPEAEAPSQAAEPTTGDPAE